MMNPAFCSWTLCYHISSFAEIFFSGHQVEEAFFSTWRKVPRHCCTWSTVIFWVSLQHKVQLVWSVDSDYLFSMCVQVCIVLCMVFGVVMYRIAVAASFFAIHNISYGQISIIASSTAALINLILILVMNKV